MNRPLAACLLAAVPALAATSLREPVSGFAGFQALPVAPVASHSAVSSWASEGRVAFLGGTGAMYGLAVTAPHLRLSYAGSDLDLRDPQTEDPLASLRRSRFEMGTGIALSQLGLDFGTFDLALGADLVRQRARDVDVAGSKRSAIWSDLSTRVKLGATHVSVATSEVFLLDVDSGVHRDPTLDLGVGQVRAGGLQWGLGASIPLHEDREFGLRVAAEKTFSQALSFRVQGSTLYRKSASTLAADSGQRKWIRSGLGLAVGTSLRFRPWLADRDPTWIRGVVDPLGGGAKARYLYDWEIGAQVQLDALSGKSTAGVTLGRWF